MKKFKDFIAEAADKDSDVYKYYKTLKKKSTKDLKALVKQTKKVIDTSDMDKESAISAILRHEFGDKKVKNAMDLNESKRINESKWMDSKGQVKPAPTDDPDKDSLSWLSTWLFSNDFEWVVDSQPRKIEFVNKNSKLKGITYRAAKRGGIQYIDPKKIEKLEKEHLQKQFPERWKEFLGKGEVLVAIGLDGNSFYVEINFKHSYIMGTINLENKNFKSLSDTTTFIKKRFRGVD